MRSWLLALALLLAPWHAAFAIDPGTAHGSLRVDGATVRLTHAFAHRHDNAEKLLSHPTEVRVLLADRDVPQGSLAGIGLGPLLTMAREGSFRGLLLRFDPGQRTRGVLTLLHAAVEADRPVALHDVTIAHNRVHGEVRYGDGVRFSAPLFSEHRVTADLGADAALRSPHARALPSTRGLERIVVRGERATAIFSDGRWAGLARAANGWRVAE